MAERSARGTRIDLKRGVPQRGDILHLDLDPTLGHEQRGRRYVLVLSVEEFNRFGLCLAAPITQGGTFERMHGFSVPLAGSGTATQGIVMSAQLRVLAYRERSARFVEKVPDYVIEDVLARARTLLD